MLALSFAFLFKLGVSRNPSNMIWQAGVQTGLLLCVLNLWGVPFSATSPNTSLMCLWKVWSWHLLRSGFVCNVANSICMLSETEGGQKHTFFLKFHSDEACVDHDQIGNGAGSNGNEQCSQATVRNWVYFAKGKALQGSFTMAKRPVEDKRAYP
jgi:hypothetical protein